MVIFDTRVKPSDNGGAICPCGHFFSHLIWIVNELTCPDCHTKYKVEKYLSPVTIAAKVKAKVKGA